jgi:hypothetical protein
VADPTQIARMEQAVTAFYTPNAAREIVETLNHAQN